MTVYTDYISLSTRGNTDIKDITSKVESIVKKSKVQNGMVLVFVPGSTASITTIEYEPGLLQDFPALMERIAPKNIEYEHHKRWHDGNGHSHVRASLMGPSLVVPVINGSLALGTWQQIVFVDFDNRPRNRKIIVQVQGE